MTQADAKAFPRICVPPPHHEGSELLSRPGRHKLAAQGGLWSIAVLLIVIAGCSSNPLRTAPPTIEPASAAVSPPPSQQPAGAVRPLAGHAAAAAFDAGTHQLAVLTPGVDPTAPASATIANRNKIFARVDWLVAQGNTTVVLDRGQTSVTTVGADGSAQQALRAGRGATSMAADPAGRVLVADTRGGQLLVYGVDPLILRQAYPVPQAPYGLVGSSALAWVSQTVSNIVIGYDLSTGIPVEKVRYPTVQQPNSLAFDEASDTLYVVSGSGAGVQVIEHAAGTR